MLVCCYYEVEVSDSSRATDAYVLQYGFTHVDFIDWCLIQPLVERDITNTPRRGRESY